MTEKEIKDVKRNIMEQIETMDERDLKKVLDFLSGRMEQEEREQEVD